MTHHSLGNSFNMAESLRKTALFIFLLAISFSVAGSVLIKIAPSVLTIVGPYYPVLVKAPTWTYMAFLAVIPIIMYSEQLGTKKMILVFLCGSLIGGISELVGTTTGFPFGDYAYTSWLGPKMLGHVPWFIPLSWFAMSIISFDLAGRATRSNLMRIVVATFFLVLWDVSLDPAMNKAFPFWTYAEDGFFFGMPLVNWVGWSLVSLLIMAGYSLILGGLRPLHDRAGSFYVYNCAFPILLSLVYGLYGAAVIGVLATIVPFVVISYSQSKAKDVLAYQH